MLRDASHLRGAMLLSMRERLKNPLSDAVKLRHLARSVMLHAGRDTSVGGELRLARLLFQIGCHHPQLPRDAQVERMLREKPAAPGEFHHVHLQRHRTTIIPIPHAYQLAGQDVRSWYEKSTRIVK